MDAELKWSAMVWVLLLEPVGDRARQDVEEQVLGLRLLFAQGRRGRRDADSANTASNVNMIVPPTVMLSASIVVVNHAGTSGSTPTEEFAGDPRAQKHDSHATYQRAALADTAEHERGEGREDAPQADATGVDEPAQRDHRERRREEDGDLGDPEQRTNDRVREKTRTAPSRMAK